MHGPLCDGQAQIRYRRGDRIVEWGVGADAVHDTDESLRAHLARWAPDAEYLGACLTQVKTGTVMFDTRKETDERHAD